MPARRSILLRLRCIGWVSATLLAITAAAGSALPAQADTAPPGTGTPTTVTSDPLPTTQMDGVAWAQVIAGGRVFVGGKFAQARPAGAAPGVQTVPRSNFLAYNLTTGELDPSFAPAFNGEVRALAVSPDGKILYVGGIFTTVNGVARDRLAAFDLISQQLLPGFDVGTNSTVAGLAATAQRLYVVGSFTSIGTAANSYSRRNAASLDPRTGAVKPFKVSVDGGTVRQVVVSPDGKKAVLGGNFTTLNGSAKPGYGLAMVDAETGASLAMPVNDTIRNGGLNSSILSLVATPGGFYGAGYVYDRKLGNLEGAFRADWNGNLVWMEDCHGDTYAVAATSKAIYTASHAHECSTIGGQPRTAPQSYERMLAFSVDATQKIGPTPHSTYTDFTGKPAPTLLHWFPYFKAGTVTGLTQAVWSLAANESYVVAGGEFPVVNAVAQQGLVRFAVSSIAPDADGPQVTKTAVPLAAQPLANGRIRLSWSGYWDRDNERLGYQLYRGDTLVSEQNALSKFWRGPNLSYVDSGLTPGQSYNYRLRVFDPYGNERQASISATASGGLNPQRYQSLVLTDGPASYWPLDSGSVTADVLGRDQLVAGGTAPVSSAGAIAGESRTGVTLSGAGSKLVGSLKAPGPTDFTTELWFKTASKTGGQLIGYSDLDGVVSDRHLYLSSSGLLNFTVSPSGKPKHVSSVKAYNDNRWHHVAASLSSTQGMALYVDGAKVDSYTTVRAPLYMTGGSVAIGGANLSGVPDRPATDALSGQVDEAAVYPIALTAAQISDHYKLGAGQAIEARPFVYDWFGTPVSSGLGWAVTGGPWQVSDPSGMSVSGGKAVFKLTKPGTTRTAYQGASDGSEVTTSFAIDKAASGSGIYVKVSGRRIDAQHDYQLVTQLNAQGQVRVWLDAVNGSSTTRVGTAVTLKGTVKVNQLVNVKLQTDSQGGTGVRAKAWLSGTTEPTGWTVSGTHTAPALDGFGQVGILAYSSTSTAAGTVNVRFENLKAIDR